MYFPSTMYGLQISFVVCHCSKQVQCGKYWWRFQNSKFPLGFFKALFASLPNIYYWVSFITNCISWQPILAQNSRDEVSWEFEQNPHFFNIEVILFDINALILQDFYLMYITFCVKLILWVLTSLTIGIKSRSTLYYVLLFSFDLWQNPEFLFVCLVAESTTDSATRLDIGILPNHTETNTNK